MDSTASDRRNKLYSLVHDYFAGNTDVVATVIEQGTPGAKVSVRSVQAWLMPPGRASSRNCPAWAVKALEDYVADPANRERLEALAQLRTAAMGRVTTASEWALKVHDQKSVELATSQFEKDDRALRRWQERLGKEPGRYIFDLEQRFLAEQRELSDTVSALHQAVHGSSSFEEFKASYLEIERASRWMRRSVKDARQRIEERSEEFASDDGALRPPARRNPSG